MTTDPKNTPEPPTPRPSQWWKVVLAISLSLNLLIVGALAGAVWRQGRAPDRAEGRDVGVLPLFLALPREDRRGIRAEIERGLAAEPSVPDAGGPTLVEALRQTPFDREAVEALFEKHGARQEVRHRVGQRVLLDRIGEMSDADRAAYADRLEKRLEGRRRR
ncbi:hypothetical protein [Aliiroseovarius sp. YM-037]|uniref:hypothetical protein n=1 Tax=Aliiroseovarius sp. YM-037 TaxID=3341728 RepID=UPI003A7F676B